MADSYRAQIPFESLDPLTIGASDDESKVYREELELEFPAGNLLASIYPEEPEPVASAGTHPTLPALRAQQLLAGLLETFAIARAPLVALVFVQATGSLGHLRPSSLDGAPPGAAPTHDDREDRRCAGRLAAAERTSKIDAEAAVAASPCVRLEVRQQGRAA